uniref:Large ribosomal subunit protein bL33m n=1 Tax=Leptobrachium leishanense TaxID=445787 RepID=A0A8C5MQV7_9ANUR
SLIKPETVAKSKSKTVLVQMMSAAGSGYRFNTRRNRLKEKLILRKYDPFGEFPRDLLKNHQLFRER